MPGPPESGPVAIVTALREEFRTIRSRVPGLRFDRDNPEIGSIGRARVVVALTGDGPERAGKGAAALCDAVRPSALIGAGVAGALSLELSIGQILAGRVIRDASGEAPPPDEALLARALAQGAVAGTLVTVDRPVTNASRRAALSLSVNGQVPAAVDMESGAWARAAAARGIPYLMLRAVSDAAEEELPEYLGRCVGGDGRVRRQTVVAHALGRPATIPALLRMRGRVLDGSARLSRFLEELLGSPS
jgi:nucleoside phosphorylase